MAGTEDIDYEVDKFLDKRYVGPALEYLVSWKGFNSDWDSWEPVDNLGNCKGKITKFEKKLKEKDSLPDININTQGAKQIGNNMKMARKDSVKILAVKIRKKSVIQKVKDVNKSSKGAAGRQIKGKANMVKDNGNDDASEVSFPHVAGVHSEGSPQKKQKSQPKNIKDQGKESEVNDKNIKSGSSPKSSQKSQKKGTLKTPSLQMKKGQGTKGNKIKPNMETGKSGKKKKKHLKGKDGKFIKISKTKETKHEDTDVKSPKAADKVDPEIGSGKKASKGNKTNTLLSKKTPHKSGEQKTPPSKDDSSSEKGLSTGKGKKKGEQGSIKKGVKRKLSTDGNERKSAAKKRLIDVSDDKTPSKDPKKIIKVVSSSNQVVSTPQDSTTKNVKKSFPSPKPKDEVNGIDNAESIENKSSETQIKVAKASKILISPLLKVKKIQKPNSLTSSNKKKKDQLKLSVINLIGFKKKTEQNKDGTNNGRNNSNKTVKSKKTPSQKSGEKVLVASASKATKKQKVDNNVKTVINDSMDSNNTDDDDDDDNILYSLSDTDDPIGQNSNKKENNSIGAQKGKSSDSHGIVKLKKDEQTEKKKTKSKVAAVTGGVDLNEKTNGSVKSKTKKIRLLDSLKPTSANKPVRPVSPTLFYTSVNHSGLLTTSGLPTKFSQPIMSQLPWTLPQEGIVHPSSNIQASLPISPASMSYKVLLENLPHQLHPKKGKKNSEEEEEDVERRVSVRASECAFKYKDILIKKCNRFTQIWLNTQTKMKNVLNPQVIQEITSALNAAKYDDSNLVMFSGLGNVFCSGVDLHYLTIGDKKTAARKMADALRDLTRKFITFPKLIVAVVTGPAVGLGATLLPLCDIVYASDKATFYMPYAELSQTPEGCASFTLPDCVGVAMANELLIGGRKITAIEACQLGLVSQVYWPTSMMQEVIPRVQHMALLSGKVLETTKLLMRSHQRTKLEHTNESECNLLADRWPSFECQRAIEQYLGNETNCSI